MMRLSLISPRDTVFRAKGDDVSANLAIDHLTLGYVSGPMKDAFGSERGRGDAGQSIQPLQHRTAETG
jgi:hypothetical protein